MSVVLYINVIGMEWRPGYRLAQDDMREYLPEFSRYMAGVMSDELVKAIDSQRYSGRWAPLSIPYIANKKRRNLSPKIWEASGVLKDSIQAYKYRDQWVVGIPKHLTYPGTTLRIYQVAQYLEYGTSKMPPRPLFRPIVEYLSKNIRRYWDRFLAEKGVLTG